MKAGHFVSIGLSSLSLLVVAAGVAMDASPMIYLVAVAFAIFGFAVAVAAS